MVKLCIFVQILGFLGWFAKESGSGEFGLRLCIFVQILAFFGLAFRGFFGVLLTPALFDVHQFSVGQLQDVGGGWRLVLGRVDGGLAR